METMMSSRLYLAALFALIPIAGTTVLPAEVDCPAVEHRPDRDLGQAIDPVVDAAVADGFAGGVALMRDGMMVYERVAGFSDARRTVPITAKTLFHVASITKYITAVLVLKAAEEERLELTGSVGELAPGTTLAGRGATIFDLLAHRSGLGSSYAAENEADGAKALAAIDSQPVDTTKVGSFKYSNDGYDLLAILLERVYGRSYEVLVREKLFSPACLERPRFWADIDLTDPRRVSQPLRKVPRKLRKRNYGMIGSAGLLITAADLVRFQRAVWGGRLLSKASVAQLSAPQGTISIGQVALGAFLIDHPDLGKVLSVRGYEDWGDNAILNHYIDRGMILAVVTSKGPAEEPGRKPFPFRTRVSRAVEEILARQL